MAVLQARSGVARANATRSGYFRQILRVVIAGVDQSTHVLKRECSITDEGRTKSATIRVRGITPTIGQTVEMSIGSRSNVLFSGVVANVQLDLSSIDKAYTYTLTCQSWQWVLNFLKPFGTFEGGDAGEVIGKLVRWWAPNFTLRLEGGLPVIEPVSCDGSDGVADVLDRIVDLIADGAWSVDANRQIDIYRMGQQRAAQPVTFDGSNQFQQRVVQVRRQLDRTLTAVVVKGVRGTLLIDVEEVRNIWTLWGGTLPVSTVDYFNLGAGGVAMVGSDLLQYSGATYGIAPPRTTLHVAAAIGNTTVSVHDLSLFRDDGGWAILGGIRNGEGQLIYYSGRAATSGVGNLTGVPATGVGSIQQAVAIDATVTVCCSLHNLDLYEVPFLGTQPPGGRSYKAGDPVVSVTVVNDQDAEVAIATLMGLTNGSITTTVDSDQLRYLSAQAYAQALLTARKSEGGLTSLTGATRDPNLWTGRRFVVNLTNPATISGTMIVGRVTVSDFGSRYEYRSPLRRFDASEIEEPDALHYLFDAAGLPQ